MALTRSESDGSPESAVADGPVAEEVDQSPGRARLHAGQLIGEFTAEAAQQLRRVDWLPFINGNEVEAALATSLERQILKPFASSFIKSSQSKSAEQPQLTGALWHLIQNSLIW